MSDSVVEDLKERVLVVALTSKDAVLTQGVFHNAGISCSFCNDMVELCVQVERGAGVLILPEEIIANDSISYLADYMRKQQAWSDLPVLILAQSGADSPAVIQAMLLLGNVTLIERPTRKVTLVSLVRMALRARQRQYQIREQLNELAKNLETKALLAAIVASSDDAIISKTLDGNIQTWNEGAERLFGYTAEEAIGQPITLLIPSERLHEEATLLERLRSGERIEHFETIRVAKDGHRIEISLTVSPIRDISGKVIGASKVARDITKRKEIETTLREAERRKDEFLAILAHELRNPLAPILNSLQFMRLGGRSDPINDRVYTVMERQVNHMVRLVDDLLEVSRITSGKIELRKEPIEVGEMLRNAVETSRPFIDAAHHELDIVISSESLILEGDPVRLSQIFSNLLNNAAKYTDEGGHIWLKAQSEGDQLTISVRDNGAGIPADMLPRIFDLFTQVDRASARGQGGLGIGLTLVKSLVEMHGGRVNAISEGLGKGAEFVVRLPLASSQKLARDVNLAANPSISFPLHRVLVVDDNRDVAETLSMLLEHLGAEVHIAYSGPDALKFLKTSQPDIIFMDIGMPGMDGYEVAHLIRQQPEHHNVLLIALTGWGQGEDRLRSEKAGFDHHLIKPADISDLELLLKSIDDRRQSMESVDKSNKH